MHWNTLYPDCIRNIHAVNARGYTVPGTHWNTLHHCFQLVPGIYMCPTHDIGTTFLKTAIINKKWIKIKALRSGEGQEKRVKNNYDVANETDFNHCEHVELLPQCTNAAISPNANSDITDENKRFDTIDIGNFDLNFDISNVDSTLPVRCAASLSLTVFKKSYNFGNILHP